MISKSSEPQSLSNFLDTFYLNGVSVKNEKYFSKSRILQPAKSTPSLLHIEEPLVNASSETKYSPEDIDEALNNIELLDSKYQGT